MPRKAKGFKSRRRDAATAYGQGKRKEAHAIWQQITVDRAKLKAEKMAKKAALKAPK